MARKHARILVTIWDDPEFTALTSVQQVVYFAVISSKDISWCGVNPLLPQRFAGIASDITERKALAAFEMLEARRFVVADRATAEVAARTFVRHDEILRQPNVTKAMGRAYELVRSEVIRDSITTELGRSLRDDPDASGWASLRAAYPELFNEAKRKASPNPSPNPS